VELDADMDGYPAGLDCDDLDRTTHPAGIEVCDGKDNDYDLEVDEGQYAYDWLWPDLDRDFYPDMTGTARWGCLYQPGWQPGDIEADCDDQAAGVNPDAWEVCGDGIDQDCDGQDCP
jgi:type IV pilus assembly protein PilY1